MKLRIQGDSLRLRLVETEVNQLVSQGRVESSIRFADGALIYSLEASGSADRVYASLDASGICVTIPAATAKAWAESSQVSIEGPLQPPPRVLVEKDFQCLHKPPDDTPGAYRNPLSPES
jgi:hypothetical protein